MPNSQDKSDPLSTYIAASAQLLELDIQPEWAAAVRTNLETALALAQTIVAFPLPDEAEPAPVFEA